MNVPEESKLQSKGAKVLLFVPGDPSWKIISKEVDGYRPMKLLLQSRRADAGRSPGTLPPANAKFMDEGSRVQNELQHHAPDQEMLTVTPPRSSRVSCLTVAPHWDHTWDFFRTAMAGDTTDSQSHLLTRVNYSNSKIRRQAKKRSPRLSQTWPVEACHRCVDDNMLYNYTDLTCYASKIHKRGNLFGQMDLEYLKKLTPRDRLILINNDPLSLYKSGGPGACSRCSQCACQRNIRDFYRAQRQQAMLDGNVRVDTKNRRFIVDDIVNEELDDIDEERARQEAIARARTVHRSCHRRGTLDMFIKEFLKQLSVGWFASTEDAERDHPELLTLPKAFQLINYAIKAGASTEEVKKKDTAIDSKTKIRMVSDLSMEALDLQGKKRIAVNHVIESGYSRLPFICEIYERFLLGEDVTVSDIDKAFYSLGLSCKSMNRTRFYFSTDPRPNPPLETFKPFLQKVCSMGSESS